MCVWSFVRGDAHYREGGRTTALSAKIKDLNFRSCPTNGVKMIIVETENTYTAARTSWGLAGILEFPMSNNFVFTHPRVFDQRHFLRG